MKNTVNTAEHDNVVQGEFKRSFVTRMVEQFKSWNERRVAIRQLSQLSDRMLRDIGIERSQIREAAARKGEFAEIAIARESNPSVTAEIRQAA